MSRPCSIKSGRISPCMTPRRRKSGFPLAYTKRCYQQFDRITKKLHYNPHITFDFSLGAFLNSTIPVFSLYCQHGFLP